MKIPLKIHENPTKNPLKAHKDPMKIHDVSRSCEQRLCQNEELRIWAAQLRSDHHDTMTGRLCGYPSLEYLGVKTDGIPGEHENDIKK
jgi:hypothetical protein